MRDVPADTPVTIPVEEPTVATPKVLLIQRPPGVLLLRVVVLPTHTVVEPLIADGAAVTVTTVVAIQPVLKV